MRKSLLIDLKLKESGYFIVDKTIIECTYWHDTEKRAQELHQKIENYLKLGFKTVLVVTTQRYRERYSNLLHPNVRVITPDNLTEMLDGKYGRVKRV